MPRPFSKVLLGEFSLTYMTGKVTRNFWGVSLSKGVLIKDLEQKCVSQNGGHDLECWKFFP